MLLTKEEKEAMIEKYGNNLEDKKEYMPNWGIDTDFSAHEIANENCLAGWCGLAGYPRKCKCGGLIHAEWGDEDSDCNFWLYTRCDRCGEEREEK